MPRPISKFIYWSPRVLAIIFILFLALFSLDVFGNGYTFWETVIGLLIHNIPSFVLLIVLLVSWRHEIVGGIAFLLAGFLYVGLLFTNHFEWYMLSWILIISGPAWLTGILFLKNWHLKK